MATSSRGLRSHLALALLAAGGLPIVLAAGLGILEYRADAKRINAALGAETLASARVTADHIGTLIASTRSALRRLSRAADEGRLSNRLIEIERAELPFLAGLFVTDERGVVRFGDAREIGTDLSAAAQFQAVRSGAEPLIIATLRSLFAPEEVVAVAVRRSRGPRFMGVVGSRIRTSHLEQLLRAHSPAKLNDASYILDREGRILAAAGSIVPKVGSIEPRHPLLLEGRVVGSGWRVYMGPIFHRMRIGGYVVMPETGWTVVSARDAEAGLVDLRAHWLGLSLAGAATALVVAYLAMGLSRRLSRPLEELSGAMRREREGDLQRNPIPSLPPTVVETRIREVAELVATYNALVAALNRRFIEVAAYEELKALAESLQCRNEEIQAQAEELQAQNEEIQAQSEELQAQNEQIVEDSERLSLQNKELARLTAEALRTNEHKSGFLASMSHELRTPLNSIIGFSELILAAKGPELGVVTRDNLEVVLRNGRHLLGLINEILDIARIEAGKVPIHAAAFDPRRVLEGVLASTEPLAAEKGLVLEADLASDVGKVETDETRFRQIALNLLANAIKFTRKGEIRVSLRLVGADRMEVKVKDTGIGIAADQQEAIFEEFRKVADPEAANTEGVGLGLAISRKLARLLGGDLTVEAALGRGSTFTLELPLRLVVVDASRVSV